MLSPCAPWLITAFISISASGSPAVCDDSELAQSSPPAGSPAAAPSTPAEVVARLQQAYEGVRDYTAAFRQELTNAALGETTTSTGTIYFKKPGRMRWDYRTPTVKSLVSDGTTLWIWEPAFRQYAAQPVNQSSAPLALRFLMGQGRLSDEFEAAVTRRTTGRLTLELTPRSAQGGVERLQFVIDTGNWTVVEVVLLDPLGNTNHLYFAEARINANLPDSGFVFTPPADAHRVDASGR
jgi:outer membrane lipoprotein carrier protein